MAADDDIAPLLPTPPQPAPAKRIAAIEAAMRRFDGTEEPPHAAPRPATPPRGARPMSGWPAPRRAFAGAILSAALIALIGGPIAWQKMWQPPVAQNSRRPAAPAAAAPQMSAGAATQMADASSPATATPPPAGSTAPLREPPSQAAAGATPAADAVSGRVAEPPPPPPTLRASTPATTARPAPAGANGRDKRGAS